MNFQNVSNRATLHISKNIAQYSVAKKDENQMSYFENDPRFPDNSYCVGEVETSIVLPDF